MIMLHRLINFFTSLKLTVACLTIALLLVFFGTLAQVKLGLYTAQSEFFRSVFIYWRPEGSSWKIPVFPGGWLLGGVLLVNLIAAHVKRFQPNRKKIGLFLVHGGLIFLLLGQFVTEVYQVESAMRLNPLETKNYSEDFRKSELVLIDTSNPSQDRVTSIPESLLLHQRQITHPELPFTLEVKNYWPNSDLLREQSGGAVSSGANQGIGVGLFVQPNPQTTSMDERDLPTAVVSVKGSKGEVGTWLVSSMMGAKQTFNYEGKTYEVAMRFLRHYHPFSITLLKFQHDRYRGTDIPKNFSSRIRLNNPQTSEDREILIYMNNPLRYQGKTFFQAGFDEKRPGLTILQVVENPAAITPYVACTVVGTGLLIHFCIGLREFARRRRQAPTPSQGKKTGAKPSRDGLVAAKSERKTV